AGAWRERGRVRIAEDVPGEVSRTRASRGVSDSRRSESQRDSPRRARLLHPAAPSEGDRRVAVSDPDGPPARQNGQGGRARGDGGRILERRHGGIPALTERRVLLY